MDNLLYALAIAIIIATGILMFLLPWFVYAIHKNVSVIRKLLETMSEKK